MSTNQVVLSQCEQSIIKHGNCSRLLSFLNERRQAGRITMLTGCVCVCVCVCDELEWMWQEVIAAYFKVLSWPLPGRTKKTVFNIYSEHKKGYRKRCIYILKIYCLHVYAPLCSNLKDNNEISIIRTEMWFIN
jgi:hypothetical protein